MSPVLSHWIEIVDRDPSTEKIEVKVMMPDVAGRVTSRNYYELGKRPSFANKSY